MREMMGEGEGKFRDGENEKVKDRNSMSACFPF